MILQISDGRMRETRGTQLLKSHFSSITKSPSSFRPKEAASFDNDGGCMEVRWRGDGGEMEGRWRGDGGEMEVRWRGDGG